MIRVCEKGHVTGYKKCATCGADAAPAAVLVLGAPSPEVVRALAGSHGILKTPSGVRRFFSWARELKDGRKAERAAARLLAGMVYPGYTRTREAWNRNKGRRSHKGGKGAPTCPACRVILSHGDCLNRMCRDFVGNRP